MQAAIQGADSWYNFWAGIRAPYHESSILASPVLHIPTFPQRTCESGKNSIFSWRRPQIFVFSARFYWMDSDRQVCLGHFAAMTCNTWFFTWGIAKVNQQTPHTNTHTHTHARTRTRARSLAHTHTHTHMGLRSSHRPEQHIPVGYFTLSVPCRWHSSFFQFLYSQENANRSNKHSYKKSVFVAC